MTSSPASPNASHSVSATAGKMLRIKLQSRPTYRKYPTEAVVKAYEAVKCGELGIKAASRRYFVPYSTLRDRVRGQIGVSCGRSGPEGLLTKAEEKNLVDHIEWMSGIGYGYSRTEVTALATDVAIHLGKKTKEEQPLSLQWFYSFLKRWPELKVQKPRSLEIMRAKATNPETVNKYYNELETILQKYNLKDRPQSIYNIDEKGIMQHHTPPHVVSLGTDIPVAVTTTRSSTTTVIGCGNALGMAIPPYFVFKGQRMREELLKGASPGTSGTVSESGWSNSEIFQKYLETHFIKYCHPASADSPLLVMYDGHTSHVSLSLIHWARERNIILFVLPPHTSHILQPMDVGCFGPFEKIYNGMRHKFIREHATSGIDRYSICEIACKAYCSALTPVNLQSSFRKSGIYPFDRNVISPRSFLPSTVFHLTEPSNVHVLPSESVSDSRPNPCNPDNCVSKCKEFFENVEQNLKLNHKPTKKRKVLSSVVGGKAITEDKVVEKIEEHIESRPKKSKLTKPTKKLCKVNTNSALPSTSGILRAVPTACHSDNESDSDDMSQDPSELCCKCKSWQPDEVKQCVSLVFVTWAQCTYESCQHWTHLKYCTPVRVIRRNAEFWCPCHDKTEE